MSGSAPGARSRDGLRHGLLAIRFVYGSESQGPPGDIGDFVRQSVALTAGWLAQQRQMVAGGPPVKPWWKFW